MKRKREVRTEERAGHDGGRTANRRVLAVGRRVKERWVIEASFVRPRRDPGSGVVRAA